MTTPLTLDLHFLGKPQVVASFLIKHDRGGILIDCGPGSTIPALEAELQLHYLSVNDITDVLLTHIHLDHAGAAGWLASRGARIHVHPLGAPHLLDPQKLIASATRIYRDNMQRLWGDFLPVPANQLVQLADGQELNIEGQQFLVLHTPGHAEHHCAFVFENRIAFTGDVAGVRLPGPFHLRVPMPPPEFHLEKWRASVSRLQATQFSHLALAHFGIFDNAAEHLAVLSRELDEVEEFMQRVLPHHSSLEEITRQFLDWTAARARRESLPDELISAYEAANPSWMSAAGMQRYWTKWRQT